LEDLIVKAKESSTNPELTGQLEQARVSVKNFVDNYSYIGYLVMLNLAVLHRSESIILLQKLEDELDKEDIYPFGVVFADFINVIFSNPLNLSKEEVTVDSIQYRLSIQSIKSIISYSKINKVLRSGNVTKNLSTVIKRLRLLTQERGTNN